MWSHCLLLHRTALAQEGDLQTLHSREHGEGGAHEGGAHGGRGSWGEGLMGEGLMGEELMGEELMGEGLMGEGLMGGGAHGGGVHSAHIRYVAEKSCRLTCYRRLWVRIAYGSAYGRTRIYVQT